MKSLLKSISNQPIFIGTGLILILLILTTQYQFWFGDYSRSDLEKIKEEISVVEKEIEIIKENNQELIDEKEKLKISIHTKFLGNLVFIGIGFIRIFPHSLFKEIGFSLQGDHFHPRERIT